MGLTVEEVLESGGTIESETEGIVTIDSDTRKMSVPDCYNLLGVESDEKTKRVFFYFPRYGGTDYDLTSGNLYVNYMNAAGNTNRYIVEDLVYNDEYVAFSWLTSRYVFEADGTVYFAVCAKLSDDDGETEQEWNTRVSSATVGEGLEAEIELEDEEYEAIAQLLSAATILSEDATTASEAAESATASATAAAEYEAAAKASAEAAAESESAAAESAETAATASETASEAAATATTASETLVNLLSDGDCLTLIVDDDGGCYFDSDVEDE